jgi:hypothetical protein
LIVVGGAGFLAHQRRASPGPDDEFGIERLQHLQELFGADGAGAGFDLGDAHLTETEALPEPLLGQLASLAQGAEVVTQLLDGSYGEIHPSSVSLISDKVNLSLKSDKRSPITNFDTLSLICDAMKKKAWHRCQACRI